MLYQLCFNFKNSLLQNVSQKIKKEGEELPVELKFKFCGVALAGISKGVQRLVI